MFIDMWEKVITYKYTFVLKVLLNKICFAQIKKNNFESIKNIVLVFNKWIINWKLKTQPLPEI